MNSPQVGDGDPTKSSSDSSIEQEHCSAVVGDALPTMLNLQMFLSAASLVVRQLGGELH